MKKLLSYSLIVFATVFLGTISVNAQSSTPPTKFQTEDMAVAPETAKTSTDVSNINAKAIKSFKRNYKTSAAVNWFDSGELIQATFSDDQKMHRVFYRTNGKWFRTIITYAPDLLDGQIESLVKQNFAKYEIKWVTEVNEGPMHCYFVNIETAKDFKQVIVYEGEVFVHQQFKKQ